MKKTNMGKRLAGFYWIRFKRQIRSGIWETNPAAEPELCWWDGKLWEIVWMEGDLVSEEYFDVVSGPEPVFL